MYVPWVLLAATQASATAFVMAAVFLHPSRFDEKPSLADSTAALANAPATLPPSTEYIEAWLQFGNAYFDAPNYLKVMWQQLFPCIAVITITYLISRERLLLFAAASIAAQQPAELRLGKGWSPSSRAPVCIGRRLQAQEMLQMPVTRK